MTRFEFYKAIVNSPIISNSTDPTDIALREYALTQYNKQAQEMEDRAKKSADAKAGQEAVRLMIERYEANTNLNR